MPKIVYFIILSVLVFAIVIAINIGDVSARAAIKFVPVSVLAEDQANYGVDKNVNTIPAVSPEIIEDKVHDITLPGSVTTIKYTTLPPRNSGPVDTGKTGDQSTHHNDQDNNGNNTSDENQNNDGNSVVNQNDGQGNGAGNDQNNGQGSSTNNGNHSTDKNKDKGNKSDKGTSSKTDSNPSAPSDTDSTQSTPKDTKSSKTK